MEKIGLHNYEAFFLDYLEGSLSAQQEFELMDFLDKHPELKAELDVDLSETSLKAQEISLDKSSLKVEGIQPDEVDDLMIASAEGMLSAQEKAELSSYVKNYGLQTDLKYYEHTVLVPDLTEGYGNKRNLKKRNKLAPIFYPVLGAAAIAVSIWGVYHFQKESKIDQKDGETVVQNMDVRIQPKTQSTPLFARLFNSEEEVFSSSHETIHLEEANSGSSTLDAFTTSIDKGSPNKEDGPLIPTEIESKETVNPQDEQNGNINKQDEILNPIKPEEKILDKKTRDQQKKDEANGIVTEEPIKVFTNLAENVFNKDISYKRDRNTKSDQLVSHHVKIGRFEFERKKH